MACKVFRKIEFFLILSCLFLFNLSCGLDTYIVMGEPVEGDPYTPEYNSIQFNEHYFDFWTKENTEYPNDFMFLGTEIYYKIYNNSEYLRNEVASLEQIASDNDNKSKAPERLRFDSSNGGYGYKLLKASNYKDSPLIKASRNSKNQHVYIRLTDYQNTEEYSAKITVNGNYLGDGSEKTVPLRFEDSLSFNFGRKGDKDKIPTDEDKDVKYNSFSSQNTWYVALFAVGVGRDVTYTPYYSNICYLGAVPISDATYDN